MATFVNYTCKSVIKRKLRCGLTGQEIGDNAVQNMLPLYADIHFLLKVCLIPLDIWKWIIHLNGVEAMEKTL